MTQDNLTKAFDLIYSGLCTQILQLKLQLSGNDLSEIIEELIEKNQQVTLDLNEADQDTSRGVEIEEKLDAIANEVDELQETNGFLTDDDIS